MASAIYMNMYRNFNQELGFDFDEVEINCVMTHVMVLNATVRRNELFNERL